MTLGTLVTRGGIALAVALGTLALPAALAGVGDAGPLDVRSAVAQAGRSVEKYPVPGSGRFKVSGRGSGHGIGMSQFGAEGMGKLGKSYRQIVNFYYPGTSFGTVPSSRAIRVLLSGIVRHDFNSAAVLVKPRSGLRVVNNGKIIDLPRRVAGGSATGYRVLRGNSGLQVRAYHGSDSKRVAAGLKGSVRFATSRTPAKSRVTVVSASGSARTYRGFLDVRRIDSGLMAISHLRIEDYLRSVVSAEVPSSWTAAALRAQAVAARSYVLLARRNSRAAGRHYDICDSTYCQVYGPIGTESHRETDAVRATARQYLKHNGKPALTMFSTANGGYSVSGGRGYLVAQPDPYDGVVKGDANWGHSWQTAVSAGAIERAWPQVGNLRVLKILNRDGNGKWGGRVLSVAIVGAKGTARVSADSFRWGVGLKSTWWTVTN